ncbi:hypothetical protein DWU95_26620, partial [Burkholderia contaminans]
MRQDGMPDFISKSTASPWPRQDSRSATRGLVYNAGLFSPGERRPATQPPRSLTESPHAYFGISHPCPAQRPQREAVELRASTDCVPVPLHPPASSRPPARTLQPAAPRRPRARPPIPPQAPDPPAAPPSASPRPPVERLRRPQPRAPASNAPPSPHHLSLSQQT